MLTERQLIEFYGYRDELLGEAIEWLTHPNPQNRESGDVALQAWPARGADQPVITFDVPRAAMETFYAANEGNRVYIEMGEMGGTMIGDLDPDMVARRFLPVLARQLLNYAESCEIHEEHAFEHIGVPLNLWLVGLA